MVKRSGLKREYSIRQQPDRSPGNRESIDESNLPSNNKSSSRSSSSFGQSEGNIDSTDHPFDHSGGASSSNDKSRNSTRGVSPSPMARSNVHVSSFPDKDSGIGKNTVEGSIVEVDFHGLGEYYPTLTLTESSSKLRDGDNSTDNPNGAVDSRLKKDSSEALQNPGNRFIFLDSFPKYYYY